MYCGKKEAQETREELEKLKKALFDRAFNARSERFAYQAREQFDDKYRLRKVHWLTIEQALVDVIEESGQLPEFERYIGMRA